MDLRQLEYFAAVARHRHFRRAAEDLYVTQSAVSQQVRRLEGELGLQLLLRTPAGVELTDAGAELLERAEGILAQVAGARAAMEERAGTLRGLVRLAVTTGDTLRIAPALARFHREHPGVRVALRQGGADEVLGLLRTGSADVAVAALPEAADAGPLDAVALEAEVLVAIAPEGDPLVSAGAVRLWDLRDRPFILAEPGTALRETVLRACAQVGFGPVPLFEAGDPATVRFLVREGLGVSAVPASWLRHPGAAVATAAFERPAPRHELRLLSRPGAGPPAAAALHALLSEDL